MAVGAGLVALSALGYGTNPIFGKVAYSFGANAITLGAIRFTCAAIGLWILLALQGQVRGLTPAVRLRLVALGTFGLATVSLLYFTALEHINASLATGLFYTYPAAVTAVGLLRGEGLNRGGAIGLLLTAAGTWLLVGLRFGGFTWQGILLILASAGLYTGFIFAGNRWTRGVPTALATAHMTSGAAVVYLVIALVTGQQAPVAGAYLAGMGLSLCSTILAIITFFAGLPKVGPTRAAIISTLEPVFTAILAAVFLSERLTLVQGLGITLVIAGAVAAQLRDGPAAEAAAEQA